MPPNHPYGCGLDCDLYYAVVKSPDYAVRIIQAARAKEDLLDESIARENTLRSRVAKLEEALQLALGDISLSRAIYLARAEAGDRSHNQACAAELSGHIDIIRAALDSK